MAEDLNDTKLVAKLAVSGNMCATESKYHKNCLTALYNKYRDGKKISTQPFELEVIEGIALAKVLNWVKDSIEKCLLTDTVPVVEQKEPVKMYINCRTC